MGHNDLPKLFQIDNAMCLAPMKYEVWQALGHPKDKANKKPIVVLKRAYKRQGTMMKL